MAFKIQLNRMSSLVRKERTEFDGLWKLRKGFLESTKFVFRIYGNAHSFSNSVPPLSLVLSFSETTTQVTGKNAGMFQTQVTQNRMFGEKIRSNFSSLNTSQRVGLTVGCLFCVRMFSTGTRPFKSILISVCS